MTSVIQLVKQLTSPTEVLTVPGISLRRFAGDADILRWIELRDRSFARQRVGVRSWTVQDFEHEILRKPWWDPSALWLAEVDSLLRSSQLVGSVTMAIRGQGASARPAVHWLMVLPQFRRTGIATMLLNHLEAHAWARGHREIWLETHTAWTSASEFYRDRGYSPAG